MYLKIIFIELTKLLIKLKNHVIKFANHILKIMYKFMTFKSRSSGYLMTDLCLSILSISLCVYIMSHYIGSLSIIDKHIISSNDHYNVLRKEVDTSIKLIQKNKSDSSVRKSNELSQDTFFYSKNGYKIEKKYTLLDKNFNMYKIDIKVYNKKRTYKVKSYFVLK